MDTDSSRDIAVAPWIDRGNGAGSRSYLDDLNHSVVSQWDDANDGRSDTQTTFYWIASDSGDNEAYQRSRDRHQLHRDPSDRRSWQELAQWNDGQWSSSRKQDNYEADIYRWVQTFCGHLSLSSYIQERVLYIVDELTLSSFGPMPVEHVILGVITLVFDTETNADPDEWSVDDWIVHWDSFESLMDDVEMDKSRLWDIRKQIHHDTDVFDDDGSTY